MFTYVGKFCQLIELCESNEDALFALITENRKEYQHLITDEILPSSISEFKTLLARWFSSGRQYQFLVYQKNRKVVGTIFFIGDSRTLSTTNISCFFVPEVRGMKLIGEALASSVKFAHELMKANRILFSVYRENNYMLGLARKTVCRKLDSKPSVSNPMRIIDRFVVSDDLIDKLNKCFPTP